MRCQCSRIALLHSAATERDVDGSTHTLEKCLGVLRMTLGPQKPSLEQKTSKNDQSKTRLLTLPTDSEERKNVPLLSGCLKYFPAALAGIARVSKAGNDKHNPGEPLHHARGKSIDHGDCILRHLTDVVDLTAARDRGETSISPETILLEVSQLAWRTLAYSQELHEQFGAPLAPAAKK